MDAETDPVVDEAVDTVLFGSGVHDWVVELYW
jgi:hypothetical protein